MLMARSNLHRRCYAVNGLEIFPAEGFLRGGRPSQQRRQRIAPRGSFPCGIGAPCHDDRSGLALLRAAARRLRPGHRILSRPAILPCARRFDRLLCLGRRHLAGAARPAAVHRKAAMDQVLPIHPGAGAGRPAGHAQLIPPELRDEIRTAKILWQSSEPICPPDSAVPSGQHYVKFSHRSGISRRLQSRCRRRRRPPCSAALTPLSAAPRCRSTANGGTARSRPRFSSRRRSAARSGQEEWKFFIANGICRFLYHERQRPSGTRMQTLYDRSFNYLPVQIADVEIGQVVQPPRA